MYMDNLWNQLRHKLNFCKEKMQASVDLTEVFFSLNFWPRSWRKIWVLGMLAEGTSIVFNTWLLFLDWFKVAFPVVTTSQQAGRRKKTTEGNQLFQDVTCSLHISLLLSIHLRLCTLSHMGNCKICFTLGFSWFKIKGSGGLLENGWIEPKDSLADSSLVI